VLTDVQQLAVLYQLGYLLDAHGRTRLWEGIVVDIDKRHDEGWCVERSIVGSEKGLELFV
jgi:hypothetical protein